MEQPEREVVNVELAYEEGEENPLDAPAITEWYHGVLSRNEAKKLLLKDGRAGAYLVRERVLPQEPTGDGEEGGGAEDNCRYALSFLSHEFKPYHFKIRCYYGTYLIGGTSFESLQSLVGYYINKGYILSGRRLGHPVPPAGEPVDVKERLVAVLPYTKNPESDELSFAKGDVFLKEEELAAGWLWVTALHSRHSGLVHSKLVRPMNGRDDVKPENLDYYYGADITQEDVKNILIGKNVGAYLLRPSERIPGNYTLYVVCPDADKSLPNHIKRFPITAEGNKLSMGKASFKIEFGSIDEIVERYRTREISEGCCLTMPIIKRRTPGSGQSGAASGAEEEDIYDSVRRAQRPLMNTLGGGGSDNVLEGYLCKFNKKWKRMYFILKHATSDLLYFEGNKSGQHPPQKIKPKGIIDLNTTDLYPAHHSLHSKDNCFQLVVSNPHQSSSQVHVLHCECDAEAENWRKVLRAYCANTREASDIELKRQNPRCVRDLVVTVSDAHNLATNKAYVCILSLNGVQVARTSSQDGKDPSWDEEFHLDDLPANMNTLNCSVYLKGRRREGECEVQHERSLVELDGEVQETECQDDGKKLRLAIRFSQLLILPRDRLKPIEYALLNDSQVFGSLAKFAEAKLDENQRKTLATSLLNIFLMNDRQSELILGIGQAVVDAGKDAMTFRQNTLLSAVLLCYMRLTALMWMHECLDRVTQEILKLGKLELDTDPSHCPMCSAIQQKPVPLHHSYSSGSTPHGLSLSAVGGASSSMSGCMCDKNSAKLNELLSIAVSDICDHRPNFPPILRHVLSHLHHRVISQWYPQDSPPPSPPPPPAADEARDLAGNASPPSHPHFHQSHSTAAPGHQRDTKLHVVAASFIFLRFLCRALSQPGSMNLTREQPSQAALSTMKSLAALILNLSTGSQPKNKKYEVMQPYLEELQPRITDFITRLMVPCDGQPPEPSEEELEFKKNISLSRECSQVLSILSKHLDSIREFEELEKLVQAVEAVKATGTGSGNTPRR